MVLLLKFVTREIKESFVSRTNVLLVGTLISIGDVGLSMVITGLWAPDKDLVNFIETNIGNKNPGVRGSLL